MTWKVIWPPYSVPAQGLAEPTGPRETTGPVPCRRDAHPGPVTGLLPLGLLLPWIFHAN